MKENINVKDLFLAHRFPLKEKPDPRIMIEQRVAQRGDTQVQEGNKPQNVHFTEGQGDDDEHSSYDGQPMHEVDEKEDDRSDSDESKQTDE